MSASVWLVGAGGRTPFVGYFRGARALGSVRLAWAGRIAASAGVLEGWEAAEAARDALAELPLPVDADDALCAAADALGRMPARWLARGDLAVLLVAADAARTRALGSGLDEVWGLVDARWAPLLPDGHPLLGEPGLPTPRPHDLTPAARWVATPSGLRFPDGNIAAACGAHP